MEQHSVARLIGAPPGYVGYEEGGYLTETVRRKPYSVILLDEIEKAHRDVFNILLQVLDDGRLTDGHGRTVDFRNTVVIMTSNLGSDVIQEMAGRGDYEAMKDSVMDIVGHHFRPEFLNRIDDIILYKPLDEDEIRKIVDLQLARVDALAEDRGIRLRVSDGARDLLAREGFDPAFGARPLKRAIQRRLQNPLALHLLEREVPEGTEIRVDVDPASDGLAFEELGPPGPEGDGEEDATPPPEEASVRAPSR